MTYNMDTLFVKEFDTMVRELAAVNTVNLQSLPVPNSFSMSKMDATYNRVILRGIDEEYYSQLNGTVAFLLSKPNLVRRKFNANGDFVKKKDGSLFTESVTLPQNCIAVLSRKRLGVPLSFKSQVGFDYVDFYVDEDKRNLWYIYIVPRQYAYKLNLCALCASLDRPRRHYGGCQVFLTTGHKLYLYVAPFKITSAPRTFRVFAVRNDLCFNDMSKELLTYWGDHGIIYNIEWLWLSDVVGDRLNAGFMPIEGTLDEFIAYNDEVSMADSRDVFEELDSVTSGDKDD